MTMPSTIPIVVVVDDDVSVRKSLEWRCGHDRIS
jgi:FixJ family two-component response regulator